MSENLTQFAKVVELRGKSALVQLYRPSACSGCHACNIGEGRNERMEIANPVLAQVGETVRIEMSPRAVLRAAMIVYLVPLAFLAIGFAIGAVAAKSLGYPGEAEVIGAGVGIAALLLSFGLLRLIDNRVKQSGQMEPVISAVVSEALLGSACPVPAKKPSQV